MTSEKLLNNYYNKGGYNKPDRIGYMMNMIRTLRPITEAEWKIWYFANVHDEDYIDNLAKEMYSTIPKNHNITVNCCRDYIHDVMFMRTFQGYNKERQALILLRSIISQDVSEAPKEWDTEYFIDFYAKNKDGIIIGIQLKPESFYMGRYHYIVDIDGKMRSFREKFGAKTFVIKYRQIPDDNEISISNPEVIEAIKKLL